MVPANDAADRYVGNGTTTTYTYNFRITNAAHMTVLLNDIVQTIGSTYTVTGIGNDIGTVVFFIAPPTGVKVTLLRNQPINQLSSYIPFEAYNPPKIMRDLDSGAMVDQMLEEEISRALKFSRQSAIKNIAVDDPVANQFLMYDSSAQRVTSAAAGSILIIPGQTGPIITPADFGAVGNDSTDDTTALQAMGVAVQNAGGGTINFPFNKTYKVYSGAQALNPLFNFVGLRGVSINMNGSQIKVYKNFVGTGSILYLMVFDATKNIVLQNMDFKQNTPVTVPGTVEGINCITFLRGCYDIVCNNIKLDGGVLPIQFQRTTASEGLTMISGRAVLNNISSTNSIYGFSCADSGNDIRGSIVTNNVMRSYFVYGCNNHNFDITSTNARSNDCLIIPSVTLAGTATNFVENLNLRYRVMGRSVGSGSTYLHIGQPNNLANGVIRNVNVEIDFDYTGEPGTGSLPTAASFVKNGAAAQNLLFDHITIHGGIRNVPASGGDLFKIFDTAQNPWSGETAKNFVIGPLSVTGSATPTFQANLHPFTGADNVFTLRDIQFPGNATLTNISAHNLNSYNVTFGDRRDRQIFVSFTPTWIGASVNPAIGNGSLTGAFRRYGKLVVVTIRMTPGSTTTFGTGQWTFGLPTGVTTYMEDPLFMQSVGTALGTDTGTAFHVGTVISAANLSTNFTIVHEGGVAGWQSNIPHTWANGDDLLFTITYSVN